MINDWCVLQAIMQIHLSVVAPINSSSWQHSHSHASLYHKCFFQMGSLTVRLTLPPFSPPRSVSGPSDAPDHPQDRSPLQQIRPEARGPPHAGGHQSPAQHRLWRRRHRRAEQRGHLQHGELWCRRVRPVPAASQPRRDARGDPGWLHRQLRHQQLLSRPGAQRRGPHLDVEAATAAAAALSDHPGRRRRARPAGSAENHPDQDRAAEPEPLQRAAGLPAARHLWVLQPAALQRLLLPVHHESTVWLLRPPRRRQLLLQPCSRPRLRPVLHLQLHEPQPEANVHPDRRQHRGALRASDTQSAALGAAAHLHTALQAVRRRHSTNCTTNHLMRKKDFSLPFGGGGPSVAATPHTHPFTADRKTPPGLFFFIVLKIYLWIGSQQCLLYWLELWLYFFRYNV